MKPSFASALKTVSILLLASAPIVCAQNIQLLSTPDPGLVPSGGGGDSWTPVVSRDGRYVLFCSTANNLLLNSNNLSLSASFPPNLNVFLRDRAQVTTTLVSVNSSGVAGGNGGSLPVDISTNGQYVLFESTATDLVPGDTNNARDVFVRDRANGTTILVSAGTNGSTGNGASSSPVITPDGRYVAFISAASDLVSDDTNGVADVFVRDLQNRTTVLVSPGALYANQDMGAEGPEISDDGHYVAFFSQATNLASEVNGRGDIFVRDLANGTTLWASSYGRLAVPSTNRICFNHTLSANGRFVAYEAVADFPLDPLLRELELTNSCGTILRYDMQTGQTVVVDTNAAVSRSLERLTTLDISPDGRFIAYVANAYDTFGTNTCIRLWDAQTGQSTLVSGDGNGSVPTNSICDWPTVDPSGRYVGFLSTAPGLVTNSLLDAYHLYLRDLQAGTTRLLDADSNGVGAGVSAVTVPRLSADARLVALECNDGSLVPGDNNHAWDVFVRDVVSGNIELISARDASLPSVTPNGPSTITPYSISGDGRFFAFCSAADNLAPNDRNGWRDVFWRDVYNGITRLVSTATNSESADNWSSEPAISAEGRYVVFTSTADNLAPGLRAGKQQVFVRDMQTGAMSLVSVNTNGTAADGDSFSPLVSPGAKFVVFRSSALDLADGLITRSYPNNVFVRDMELGKTVALSQGGAFPVTPAMTPDGRFIAVAVSNAPSVRVWDTQLAGWVSGTPTNTTLVDTLAITPDGKKLAFTAGNSLYLYDLTTGNNQKLGPGPVTQVWQFRTLQFNKDGEFLMWVGTYGSPHVFLYDRQSPTESRLVDHAYFSASTPGNWESDSATLSPDGRFVVYRSLASDLVPGDTNGFADIFIYDRLTGTNTLLSLARNEQFPNQASAKPVFTSDGRTILLESSASDLVSQDFNNSRDIFAYPFLYAEVAPGASLEVGTLVSWPFIPGRNYRVQFQDSAGAANWYDLSGSISNFGTRAYIQDLSSARQRFYRVLSY